MRYKYFLLLWYLCLISVTDGENTESKKKTDQDHQQHQQQETEKIKSAQPQEVRSTYEKLREQVIKLVEAPDLSKAIEQEQKKREEEAVEGLDEESLERLWKNKDTLFQLMVSRIQNNEDPNNNNNLETDKKKLDDEDEAFKVIFNKQKNLLKRMIAQLQGYGNLDEIPNDFEQIGMEMSMEPSSPAVEPVEDPPELSPTEKAAQELYEKGMKMLTATRPKKLEAYSVLREAGAMGNVAARIAVAWAQLLGTPLRQDISAANRTFHELAENGVADAHMGVGFLYATGLAGNTSQARALVHYTFGALGGSAWARMALGYRYCSGATVAVNCEKALDFYRKVANKVAEEVSLSGGTAVQRVRLLEEAENPGYNSGILDNDLMEYYQLLAEKGDVQAQVGLGQLHYQGGRGVQQDLQRALHYFLQAADAGNAIAMAFLGKIYLEGSDIVKQDNVTAYKYFKKAADLGNPVGQSGLGLMYLYGKGVVKDYNKAFKYFLQAADQGWVDGQLQLGNMYFGGKGVQRDYKLANKYFSLASQSGHVLAFYNLAQMHATGTGMQRSCHTAVELYKNVAERGKWGERLMEAHIFHREGRADEAFVIYALLAELGYEVAQSNAAYLLDRGDVSWYSGTDRYVVALMYWGRAAAQGYSAAQVKLGDYHYYGLGTPVDYEMAATHYRLASDQQRNAQAMFNLGYMHEQGLGMQQDMHLAKRCYDMAAETSVDAKVPVMLALIKLSILFACKFLQDGRWYEWLLLVNVDQFLGPNWDILLGTVLVGLIGIIVYYRRPQPLDEN